MKHALADTLVMLAELTVRPDKRDAFLAYTAANLPLSRAYPGNLTFEILLDPTRPDTVRFYEVWESPEAQQAYMAWRVQAGDLTKLLSLLAAEPRFTPLRSIAF